MATTLNDLRQVILAARLYYEQDRTQEEVAQELGLSRPTVSRLLRRAREEGIVQIQIFDPFIRNSDLAEMLCQKTGLRTVMITKSIANRSVALRHLAIAARDLLERTLKPNEMVGIGWGRTLHAVAQTLAQRPFPVPGLQAVPLLGGLGQISPNFQVHEIIRLIVDSLGGDWRQLYVPAIVEDEEVQVSLLKSPDVDQVFQSWNRLTLALVGIGNVSFDQEMQMLFAKYLDAQTRARLEERGAVGDICMRFFDLTGKPVEDGLRGVIGIELDQLKRIPQVIAVAGGREKANAILGAIRGGFIHALVTDESVAQDILEKL